MKNFLIVFLALFGLNAMALDLETIPEIDVQEESVIELVDFATELDLGVEPGFVLDETIYLQRSARTNLNSSNRVIANFSYYRLVDGNCMRDCQTVNIDGEDKSFRELKAKLVLDFSDAHTLRDGEFETIRVRIRQKGLDKRATGTFLNNGFELAASVEESDADNIVKSTSPRRLTNAIDIKVTKK